MHRWTHKHSFGYPYDGNDGWDDNDDKDWDNDDYDNMYLLRTHCCVASCVSPPSSPPSISCQWDKH